MIVSFFFGGTNSSHNAVVTGLSMIILLPSMVEKLEKCLSVTSKFSYLSNFSDCI